MKKTLNLFPHWIMRDGHWIALLFFAVLATTISMWIGANQSLWFDEAYSILVAKSSVGEIIRLVSVDTHPPIYYILLHFWGDLFAWNIVMLRLFSALAFGGAVLVMGLFVKRFFDNRTALIVVGLTAISPLIVRYGFEIRMYALVMFIGVLATYVLALGVTKRKPVYWIFYGLLVTIGMMTLYYSVVIWLAHLVWLVYLESKKGNVFKRFLRTPWFWTYFGSAVLFTAWLPVFIKQIGNGSLAQIGQPMNVENILGVVTFNTVYQPLWQVGMFTTITLIFFTVALVYLVRQAGRQFKKSEFDYTKLLSFYILVPVVLLMIISLIKPMYVERYLSHVGIGLMALIGVFAGVALRKSGKMSQLAVIAVFLVVGIGLFHLDNVGNFNFERMEKPSVDKVADSLNDSCAGTTTVVGADPYVATELKAIGVGNNCDLYFYNSRGHLSGGYAPLNDYPKQLSDKDIDLASSHSVKYVYYGEPALTFSHYSLVSSEQIGKLTIDTYSK